jgi:hypothetical protein
MTIVSPYSHADTLHSGPVLLPWKDNANVTAILWAGIPGMSLFVLYNAGR